MLFEAYCGEAVESQMPISDINGSKGVASTWKIKEVIVQYLTKPTKMLKKCGNLEHSGRLLSIRAMAVQLNWDRRLRA
jgi:hypothetical protein